MLADEVLTPDSSRFWDAARWRPGQPLHSFDKQFVRDWLLHESGWDRARASRRRRYRPDIVAATRSATCRRTSGSPGAARRPETLAISRRR